MALDYAFLAFVVPFVLLAVSLLFRKRLLIAITGMILMNGVKILDEMMWETVVVKEKGKKVKQKILSPYAQGLITQAMPVILEEGMKAVKLRIPQNLPINPETGQLDFMAPIVSKLASGKKLKIDDFLPLIMDKVMPHIDGLLGRIGGGGKSKTGEEAPHPFLKS